MNFFKVNYVAVLDSVIILHLNDFKCTLSLEAEVYRLFCMVEGVYCMILLTENLQYYLLSNAFIYVSVQKSFLTVQIVVLVIFRQKSVVNSSSDRHTLLQSMVWKKR